MRVYSRITAKEPGEFGYSWTTALVAGAMAAAATRLLLQWRPRAACGLLLRGCMLRCCMPQGCCALLLLLLLLLLLQGLLPAGTLDRANRHGSLHAGRGPR
eukprot:COSAG01_NODE_5022_length_4540_cov_6.102229_4_plen_101_part_00